jgi:hypothetical protein
MSHPCLEDVAPELVVELQRLLLSEGEAALADQIPGLILVERCRCGEDFCATFYTELRPRGSFDLGHQTIALSPDEGTLNIDVVETRIVQIEVLYRDELRKKIHSAIP